MKIKFLHILFFIFLTLKLCNVIDWSWWYVSLPITLPIVVYLTVLLFVGFMCFVGSVIEKVSDFWDKIND